MQEKLIKDIDKKSSIRDFRIRDFSEFCEYVVAFKLQELGWNVFQPLLDRYIDIIATKKINDKWVLRTIQVKGSRIEREGEQLSYGLTHRPKDLMHDSAHFFIWVFFDEKDKENFIILSVSDFLDLMGEKFFKSMSWRKGNCRIHFKTDDLKNKLNKYLNNWESFTKGGKLYTSLKCITCQEIYDNWKNSNDNITESWKKSNNEIKKEISPEMLKRIRRKIGVED